ncbi:hypothetical protein Taro_013006 [Colocasia esculenta]|uniref:Secreted protein n=1 Tax=Colocasia esculenta TaxID=4460 RepID=A0A843U5H7_COLES|nr:hypothetical protein [Colocasia esculenta]
MSFISMTFALVPLVGFCTSTGRLQVFRVHECRRRGVCASGRRYTVWEYINVRDRVFVPPSGCLCRCRTTLPRRTSFGDGGGLKYKRWESCDNLWRLPADVAQCSPNAEDGTPTGAKDFSSARAAYLSSRTDTL